MLFRSCLINLETDMAGKYIVRQLELAEENKGSTITMDTLSEAGFL